MNEHIEQQSADAATTWRVRRSGTVLGTATAQPGSDPGTRFLRLWVSPDQRLCGVGSRLLDAVVTAARAEGFSTLEAIVEAGSPGDRFAHERGARVGDELVEMTLQLVAWPPDQVRALAGAPEGYRLVHWWGSAPEVWLTSYAAARRYLADAPNAHAPPVQGRTPGEVRDLEATRSGNFLTVAAVCGLPEAVVAFSELSAFAGPAADQYDTAVAPEHRGRGLATAVKAEAITRLRTERPDVATLTGTTAVANIPMRTVNRRLGFVETRRRMLVRLSLDRQQT